MSKKLAFDCKMCGQCCQGEGGIVVTDEEQKHIAHFLRLSLSEFKKKYIYSKSNKDFIQTARDNFCVFFQKETGCLIHPVKPRVCRAWPFFKGNLVDKTSWEMAKEYCPGINPDVSFEEFIRQGLDYLRKHNLISKHSKANALKI